jgi:hypothetical protein
VCDRKGFVAGIDHHAGAVTLILWGASERRKTHLLWAVNRPASACHPPVRTSYGRISARTLDS